MRIRRLPLIVSAASVILLSSFIAFYPTGAPAAKTGSPGDGSNCTECHGGTASTVSGWITSNIPAEGYTPGQTYQITASNQITGSGKFGFEVSPQNTAGSLLGTLTAGTGTQLVGSNKYVTHTNANTTTSTWTFSWTAPTAGTGTVTFYGAFARNKPGPVRLSTLVVNEATVSLPGAAGPITGPSTVCKNNSESYSVGTISGATSYNWSVPAGASILSGQGTTSVSVSFGSSSVSGNVSVYGSNTAGNGAASNLSVTVNSAPAQPSSIAGLINPCAGSSQTYSVTAVSGVTYNWTVPGGSNITAGQNTNSITVTIGNTSGDITVIPSNSCGSGSNRSVAIIVNAAPGQANTPSGPDVVDLHSVTTSDFSTTALENAASYQWEISPSTAGSISGTGLTGIVTWNSTFLGVAEVRVKALNSCGEGSWSIVKTTEVINTTGIGDGLQAIQTQVYPNPSNGAFTLVTSVDNKELKMEIFDLNGKVVYRQSLEIGGTSNLNIPLNPGVYMMVVSDGSRSSKTRIMIQ